MSNLNRIDRRMPYRTSEVEFEAMAERIRLRTTARVEVPAKPEYRRPSLQLAFATAVAVIVAVVGTWFAIAEPEPQPTLAELLATASPETLRELAATNYDDIIFNQQI